MTASVRADVTPTVLRWARDRARLTVEQAAKKASVKPDQVVAWEAGESPPTLAQVRALAMIYRRPLSFFFLSEPPRDFTPMVQDYRRISGEIAGTMSPELAYQIRRAQERREIALELYEAIDEDIPRFDVRAELSDAPEDVARRLRLALGVDHERQARWRQEYDSLNGWRAAIEAKGVLIFQASGIPVRETRGLSLAEDVLPVIVVNTKDTPNGRVFTLFHELCHIALRRSGICDIDFDDAPRPPEEQRVEVFCNRIAALTLVPTDLLRADEAVRLHSSSSLWSDVDLQGVARRFGVSREVILRRLLSQGLTTQAFYREKRAQFEAEYAALAEKGGKPVVVTQDKKAILSAGPTFVRLVLDSYHQERITTSDVADYLAVKVKHLPNI
jgi:Zn-dependent peptidase ImmA (M78 family)/DNA-binding XRE family transcriptional regulator